MGNNGVTGMEDEEKTKEQLLYELKELRNEVAKSKKARHDSGWVEAALRESEERYKRLLESIVDYIYTVKVENGRPVSTTHGPGCVTVTGYTSEEYLIHPNLWYEMIYEEDRKAVLGQSERILAGEVVQPLEHRIIHKDGSICWVRNAPVPHYDKDGRLVSYDGIIVDITERKQAEEELKESENKFRTLAERLPNMVFINKKGRIVYANAKCEELMKYKRDEFYSPDFNFPNLIAPQYKELVKAKFNKHMRGEEVEPYEYAIIARDGRRIDAIINTALLNYEGEKAILGIITDITERKEMEEALRESKEKFRTIAVSANDAIIMMDDEAKISYWNPAAERIFGYSKEEAIGKILHELIVPMGRHAGFSEGFKRFQETGEGPVIGKTLELAGIKKDGTDFFAEHSISAVKVKGKWNAIGIVRDVSERKQAEEALRASQEYARSIIESSMDMIIAVDKDRRITEFNKAAQEAFGYTLDEVLGKHVDMLYADTEEGLKVHNVTMEIGRHLQEILNRRKNGELFPTLLSSSILRNSQGGIVGLMGVSHDITRRKRNEEALREFFGKIERAKKEWEVTFDSIADPLFIHDNEFKVVRANRAYRDASGMTFDEIIGRAYYEVFPKMDRPFNICMKAPEIQEDEFSCRVTNRIFKVRSYPIKDANGNYLYSVHILEDVTEARRAQKRTKEEMEVTSHFLMIAKASASTTDIDRLMEEVTLCTCKILGCDICLSYLYDKESEIFQPAEAFGVSNKMIPIFRTESIDKKMEFVRRVMKGKKPAIISPLSQGEGQSEVRVIPWLKEVNTLAAIPLIGKTGHLGLMIGVYKNPVEISERDKEVMDGISNQISVALEQARFYKESLDRALELSQKIETIKVMHDIDVFILSTLASDEILETVTRMIGRVVPSDMVSIDMVDKERGGFVCKTMLGTTLIPKGMLVPFTDTSAREVFETGRAESVNNISERKPLLPLEKKLLDEGLLSHIRVPIVTKGDVVGMLTVGSKRIAAFTKENFSTLGYLCSQIGVAIENSRLISDFEELFISVIKSLSSAIDAKSSWTAGHSERVTRYALQIGAEMGFSEKELKELELAGLLHDVGKIGTYEAILDKPGKLSDEEQRLMRLHPVRGAEILQPIKQLKTIIPAVRHHHEFYDGTGYPDGLPGGAIPHFARILTVADTLDAMGADRPYRKGMAMDVIIAELKRCSGTQFDPKVVEAFLKTVSQ